MSKQKKIQIWVFWVQVLDFSKWKIYFVNLDWRTTGFSGFHSKFAGMHLFTYFLKSREMSSIPFNLFVPQNTVILYYSETNYFVHLSLTLDNCLSEKKKMWKYILQIYPSEIVYLFSGKENSRYLILTKNKTENWTVEIHPTYAKRNSQLPAFLLQ